MVEVVQYSRRSVNGLYDIKICNNQGCSVEVGFYKIRNPFPSGNEKQIYSFPTTSDNLYFFVPSRVVEDPSAFSTYVLDVTKQLITCLAIDPCNVHTQKWCCAEEESSTTQTDKEKKTDGFVAALLVYVLVALFGLFIIMIGAIMNAK